MATSTLSQQNKLLNARLGNLLPSLALGLIMCGAVVYSLAISAWAPGLGVLLPMSLPGFVLGAVFARMRRVPGWLAHQLSSVLAIVWAVQLLGEQMDPALTTWRDRAIELLIRTIIWARVLMGGGRGEDLLLFVAALCLLCWALVYDSAWQIFRHGRSWRTVTVNGAVILINYTYVLPKPDLLFFVFLGAAMLLIAQQHMLQRQAQWESQQIEYPDLLTFRFLWSAALACGLLIGVTATFPGSVSIDRATRTWGLLSNPFKLARDRWEDAFATLNAPPGAGSGSFAAHTSHLGGSRRLNDNLVMTVHSTAFEYWRAVAFDTYSDGQWQNTIGEQARAMMGRRTPEQARSSLIPGEPLPLQDRDHRQVVTETFTLAQSRNDHIVFVGGSAHSSSIPVAVEHSYQLVRGLIVQNFDDTSLIASRENMSVGMVYTITALVSRADIQSLKSAGSDYPNWVRERYLQIPDSVTSYTRDLAVRIVSEAGAVTPYEQAVAIEAYLRTFRYNETITLPSNGVDPIEWFLFDKREGYCDYFASSMVMMLRSLGVPSRWAQGYAGGVFNAERGVYEVRENVAHSWPEVYFPGIGWERFEPTPASYTAPPVRPLAAVVHEQESATEGPLPSTPIPDLARFDELDKGLDELQPEKPLPPTPQATSEALGWPLAILGGGLGIFALLALATYARWRYELRGLSLVAASYASVELLAGWGGNRQPAAATPLEYAAQLAQELPAHRTTIFQIAAAYQAERYHHQPASLPSPAEEQALRRDLVRRIFIRFSKLRQRLTGA
ncbi:MAG: transglutaminase domain-containing protein [Oscillochloris sp.]|nr:transglutaminase domain-containing protein [Oscillochloris sp.]